MNRTIKYILTLSLLAAVAVLAQTVVTQLTIDVTDVQRTALRWYARQHNKALLDAALATNQSTNNLPTITWQQGADNLFKARMDKIVREHKAWLDAKVVNQYGNADTNTQSQIKNLLNVVDE